MHRNRLVPVRIEDVRPPPLEFRRLQTADWLDWRRGVESPGFDACLHAIEFLVSHTTSKPLPSWEAPAPSELPSPEPAPAPRSRRPLILAVATTLSGLGFGVGWLLGTWFV